MRRAFFSHIASAYGKDSSKYVAEVRGMTDDDWLADVGAQIVATARIAKTKHAAVRSAAIITLIGLASWVISVVSVIFTPTL